MKTRPTLPARLHQPGILGQFHRATLLTPHVREETLPHGIVGDEALDGTANLIAGQWM